MKNDKQVTIEFATKKERDLFKKWYKRSGCTHFFCYLTDHNRKLSEEKMNQWPKQCERFV